MPLGMSVRTQIRSLQTVPYLTERCTPRRFRRLRGDSSNLTRFRAPQRCLMERGSARWGYWRAQVSMQTGIFPSGKKQAQLEIPALILSVTPDQISNPASLEQLKRHIKDGITAVLLKEDAGGTSSAGALYEAALKLQDVLRDRAALWIAGRSDIAEAVEAQGVVLTDESVPLAVARRVLRQKSMLLGKVATTAEEAQSIASEGASFVLWSGEAWSTTALQAAQTAQKGGRVPVLPVVDRLDSREAAKVRSFLAADLDGLCVGLDVVATLSTALRRNSSDLASEMDLLNRALGSERALEAARIAEVEDRPSEKPVRRLLLTDSRERMRQREKELLENCLEVLQRVSPEIEERTLLEAAIKQLDELFLVVVVGEYNSGKSSVVNALLGSRYLDEGILPTTNEICVLRYAATEPEVSVLPDGIVERTLPAALLQEINVVDTPGTNVVLERQQRLTEEYVPRADMVLFVLSCDRPFTESEVRFLEYIRKWGKKVIFVVNKIDILSGDADVASVRAFVYQNAKRLLNLTEAFVWPVSARRALDAKLALGNSSFGGLYPSNTSSELERDERWRSSRFAEMESFVAEFFSGAGGAASAESVRLKLQTPLYVADALLDASRRQLKNERFAAEKDVAAAKAVSVQLGQFETEMRRDGRIQQQALKTVLEKVTLRAEAFVEETLLVSNFFTLRGYLSESTAATGTPSRATQGFAASVLGSALTDVQDKVDQQSTWIQKNCDNQLSNYRAFAENCAQQLDRSLAEITSAATQPTETPTVEADTPSLSRPELLSAALENKAELHTILQRVAQDPQLGIEMCERLMENEIRDAVNATGGTALAAIGVGFVLTFVLPTTAEDVLALSISLLIGYVALLNLPLRRGEIKSRIRGLKSKIESELEKVLEERLTAALAATYTTVHNLIHPLETLFQVELKRVIENEEERGKVESQLQSLKAEILNIE